MAKRRALGRGLDALLGSGVAGIEHNESPQGTLRDLPIDLVRRGRYQPRRHMDPTALEELASSIRAQGVVQPIVVRPLAPETSEARGGEGEAHYEIIAGERRWRAAQAAGLETIPALIRDVGDDAALAMAFIENIQREDLNPLEEAQALARFVDEFGLTHQAAADAVGRSRASVSNLLRLLELNEDVRAWLADGTLDMGQGRALLGLSGEVQSRAAREVVSKALTARQTEQLVRRLRAEAAAGGDREGSGPVNPDVQRLEQNLSERLGASVRIEHNARGRGRLVIRFSTLEEFEGIIERIN